MISKTNYELVKGYMVQFEDGLVYAVFDDELMDSPKEFYRPDPPKKEMKK